MVSYYRSKQFKKIYKYNRGGSNVELTYRDEQTSGSAIAKRERALSSNVIPGRDNRMGYSNNC